jgi:signal transduction histidine kinase
MEIMINLSRNRCKTDSPKKLLLIEDDASVVASLKLLLKSRYEIHSESTVASGVSRFRDLSPSLVVLDLRLPDGEGLEVLREIRRMDAKIPVVVLTGYASMRTAEESLRLGASDYLHKPFDGFVLKSRIDQLLLARELPENPAVPSESSVQDLDVAALKLKADASAMFLHDVAGPMSVALTSAHYLCDFLENQHPSDSHTQKRVELMMNAMGFLSGLFEQSRSIECFSRLPVFAVKVSKIVDLALLLVQAKAMENNVPIEVRLSNADTLVRVNLFALARVLVNLLQNAFEAVRGVPGGRVTLVSDCSDGHVNFSILDNGLGIPPELMERIFEPHFTTKENGGGLGLHISKHLITNMCGDIVLRSTPGHSCCFSIMLPIPL